MLRGHTSHRPHVMSAGAVLPDMGADKRAKPRVHLPHKLHLCDDDNKCPSYTFSKFTTRAPCTCDSTHGTCDPLTLRCLCQPGFVGTDCQSLAAPACALAATAASPQPRTQLALPCASLGAFSPVACACLDQCASDLGDAASGLQCIALAPSDIGSASSLPAPASARLVEYAEWRTHGFVASAGSPVPLPLPVAATIGASWVEPSECGPDRCSGRGRCLRPSTGGAPRCVCMDGSSGASCERTCSNDCLNDCSGHGECVHGWCACDPGWHGTDCSDAVGLRYARDLLLRDENAIGRGRPSADPEAVPEAVSAQLQKLRRRVYVYQLPGAVNRAAAAWSPKLWGGSSSCDPVHNRRERGAQAHFDAHLFHDDYTRTATPGRAALFYVPLFFTQRAPAGAAVGPMVACALSYIRHAHPFWNASGGSDHVWFVADAACEVPREVASVSTLIGYAVPGSCLSPAKDVVVPALTPAQIDFPRYLRSLQPALARYNASVVGGGRQQRWRRQSATAELATAADATADLEALVSTRFCLHAKANVSGSRLADSIALGCIPLVEEGAALPYANIISWQSAGVMLTRGAATDAAVEAALAGVSADDEHARRAELVRLRRGFIWWRPEGRAYEFTLAAIGERAAARGLPRLRGPRTAKVMS